MPVSLKFQNVQVYQRFLVKFDFVFFRPMHVERIARVHYICTVHRLMHGFGAGRLQGGKIIIHFPREQIDDPSLGWIMDTVLFCSIQQILLLVL